MFSMIMSPAVTEKEMFVYYGEVIISWLVMKSAICQEQSATWAYNPYYDTNMCLSWSLHSIYILSSPQADVTGLYSGWVGIFSRKRGSHCGQLASWKILFSIIAIDIANDVYKYTHLKSSLPWKCYLFLSQHNTYLTCSRTLPTTFKKVQIHVSNKGILFIKVTKFRRITDHLIKTF